MHAGKPLQPPQRGGGSVAGHAMHGGLQGPATDSYSQRMELARASRAYAGGGAGSSPCCLCASM